VACLLIIRQPITGFSATRRRWKNAYGAAIDELKKEGKLPPETEHRQVKYLNNVIKADHGKLKQLIRPVRGFKKRKTAYATIKGFEVMHALKKGQGRMFNLQGDIHGQVRMIERAFGLGLCALSEAVTIIEAEMAKASAYSDRKRSRTSASGWVSFTATRASLTASS